MRRIFFVILVQLKGPTTKTAAFSLVPTKSLLSSHRTTTTNTSRVKRLPNHSFQLHPNGYDIEVLSNDPKCFLIHNFLSREECQAFISKLSEVSPERIKQSNAPKVSLQVEKLWPLPFLCMGTGIPPLFRLFVQQGQDDISWNYVLSVAIPPIFLSFGIVAILMIAITASLQKLANQSARTSISLALNTQQDCEFIQPFIKRTSAITHHPWMNWEAPVVTKYSPGALFASHNDASPTMGSEWADLGGQRLVTVITYLNTCERGGATKFDLLDFQVQPKEGTALVFFPADETSLKADGRTVHQSLPAVDEKYIVQLFGRQSRVPPPLGIPDEMFAMMKESQGSLQQS